MRFASVSILLMASSAWAQSGPTPSAPVPQVLNVTSSRSKAAASNLPRAVSIAAETPVITIYGLCETAPSGRNKATTAAPAPNPKNCKTVVTRAQFDSLAEALQPTWTPASRRQLAEIYPKLLVMQREFRRRGLDKDAKVKESMAFTLLRFEAETMAKSLKETADVVSDADVDKYYAENTSGFQTAELDRIFVPADQKKASKDGQPDFKKDGDSGEAASANAVLKQRADAIRARAAAGQDFEMLQKEAYESAGAEGQPSTHLGKVSANDLPAAHRTILGLKEGELSEPISDPGGYYIYKVGRKSVKPVDQVRPEIKAILSQMRFTEAMRAVEQSVRTELNDSYVPGAGFHVNGKRNASDAQPLGARRMPPVAGQPRP